jgi:hypothetical protein
MDFTKLASRKDNPVASSTAEPAGHVVTVSEGNRVWKWATHSLGSTGRLLARLNDNDLALAESGAFGGPD